jgi:hypothetical protein
MKFVAIEDDGDAVERVVSGFSSIERISPGLVRETYYVEEQGVPRAVLHVVWEINRWIDFQLLRGLAIENIRRDVLRPPSRSRASALVH